MARNSTEEAEKWENSEEEEEEEEEAEALSLCDLPVNFIKEAENQSSTEFEEVQETEANQEDFDFGPWGGSVYSRPEMCAADDIFFQGQILPFRLSVSSENGLSKLRQESVDNPSRCVSRSESMDHGSVGGFTSFSSRSSSSRSQLSSGSTTSSVATCTTRISDPRSRIQNQFHTHPSPKPHIKISSSSLQGSSGNNRNIRKSTVWDFFRLGLVRTPEIELQDLKIRASVSRNSSSSSSNSSSRGKSGSKNQEKNMEKQRKQSFLEKRSGGGGLLSRCNCTVSSVKPIPLNIIIIKSSNNSTGNNSNNDKSKEKESTKTGQKLQELKIKKKKKKETVEKQQQQQKQQGKQIMSRHRTFEWIKELSHSSFLDHEQQEEGLDS